MARTHQAAKIATFGKVTDRTEMRWCPYCRKVKTVPTIPPEDGDGVDLSVYDCECGRRMEKYDPGIDHDRCQTCGDYIPRGSGRCEQCANAANCERDGCDNKAPWGDYCHPQCQDRAQTGA